MKPRRPSGKSRNHPPGGGSDRQSQRPGQRPAPRPNDRQTRWQFGQNFLVDPGVVRALCEDVGVTAQDWVIEIGPGQGALTRILAPLALQTTVIEIDPHWVEKLRAKEWGSLDVVQADATRIDVEALLAEHAPPDFTGKPILAGNLPYNRAAPILFHFLPHLRRFAQAQFMVQYEVAKRICAKPDGRDFGSLTVAVQNHAEAVLLRKIEPDAFRPRPKVWSATLRLTPRPEPLCADPAFSRFVELCFSQKRKKLVNVLEPFYGKTKVLAALESGGISADARAEVIGVEPFAELLKQLGPVMKSGRLDSAVED
jgi:16S rRNA (adenine1518-N6/adenine1519-N6)-dimethyltransferase